MKIRENIRTLAPYVPGKPIEELERELGIREIVKLASNENPLGPSPKGVGAVREILSGLARYPDGSGFELRRALAARHGVDPGQIILGNGSNDVLEIVARTFLGPDDEAVFSQYAFLVYPLVTKATGAIGVEVPAAAGLGHDLAAMAAAISPRTRLVFLANPNNPTGTLFGKGEWEGFLERVPENVILVVDEAYAEYVTDPDYPDAWRDLAAGRNIVITRTFSKIFGLAGLRLGYGVTTKEIADLLNRVRQPFNVNSLALKAGVAALGDEAFVQRSRDVNTRGLRYLRSHLEKRRIEAMPSWGNFLLADLKRPAGPFYAALLRKGVIVRPVAGYGLPNHLRITVGTQEELEIFAKALDGVVKELS